MSTDTPFLARSLRLASAGGRARRHWVVHHLFFQRYVGSDSASNSLEQQLRSGGRRFAITLVRGNSAALKGPQAAAASVRRERRPVQTHRARLRPARKAHANTRFFDFCPGFATKKRAQKYAVGRTFCKQLFSARGTFFWENENFLSHASTPRPVG